MNRNDIEKTEEVDLVVSRNVRGMARPGPEPWLTSINQDLIDLIYTQALIWQLTLDSRLLTLSNITSPRFSLDLSHLCST